MSAFFGGAGALLGFLSVALGAFAAHALKGRLAAHLVDVFETAVRYQMVHALALLVVALLLRQLPSGGGATLASGWAFLAGTAIFSGTLYLYVATGARWLGMITPLGGVTLLAGWVCLFISFVRA
ncbi:MAG: DUF423 domain-containing protein [Candidatus Schekmanbacteria bacterium]|nr:DUF423 domain-containing protein [Candidatus Schekmanbacteria bacterium]